MRLPVLAAIAALASTALLAPSPAMATEEPAFTVVERDGDIELRDYAPIVVAETVVDGDLSTASNRGFRAIAGFIFGANRPADGDAQASRKIAMTTPVVAEPVPRRIAMTAPVTAEPLASGVQAGTGAGSDPGTRPGTAPGATGWRIAFVMPREYTLATLPRPTDPSVTLREVPGERVAVLRFSGTAGEQDVTRHADTLRAWIATRGLVPAGTVRLARYDPPWTLPFMRRNEVMLPVAPR